MLGSIPEESTYGANSSSSSNTGAEASGLGRGFGPRNESPSTPVNIQKGNALGIQGGSSSVYDGTLNGAPILIKVISFNTVNAEMDLITEKDAHNEINITQLLKNKVGACDDDSELICFLGYACNTYYNKENI